MCAATGHWVACSLRRARFCQTRNYTESLLGVVLPQGTRQDGGGFGSGMITEVWDYQSEVE